MMGGGHAVNERQAILPTMVVISHTFCMEKENDLISLYTDIAHERKITGLPQTLTLYLRNFTSPNFCIYKANKHTPESMQHIKGKENCGFSMV